MRTAPPTPKPHPILDEPTPPRWDDRSNGTTLSRDPLGDWLAEVTQGDSNAAVEEGGYRFWACAPGPRGRSQTTAVWGLWMDHVVVFAADTEGVAAGDPPVFPASVVQLGDDGEVKVVDGTAERVDDPAILARFIAACEAKYGFEPDPGDPDTPVFVVRPG